MIIIIIYITTFRISNAIIISSRMIIRIIAMKIMVIIFRAMEIAAMMMVMMVPIMHITVVSMVPHAIVMIIPRRIIIPIICRIIHSIVRRPEISINRRLNYIYRLNNIISTINILITNNCNFNIIISFSFYDNGSNILIYIFVKHCL